MSPANAPSSKNIKPYDATSKYKDFNFSDEDLEVVEQMQ